MSRTLTDLHRRVDRAGARHARRVARGTKRLVRGAETLSARLDEPGPLLVAILFCLLVTAASL